MKYRVQLNTDSQLFTVLDKKNPSVSANGKTISEAVNKLQNKWKIFTISWDRTWYYWISFFGYYDISED